MNTIEKFCWRSQKCTVIRGSADQRRKQLAGFCVSAFQSHSNLFYCEMVNYITLGAVCKRLHYLVPIRPGGNTQTMQENHCDQLTRTFWGVKSKKTYPTKDEHSDGQQMILFTLYFSKYTTYLFFWTKKSKINSVLASTRNSPKGSVS